MLKNILMMMVALARAEDDKEIEEVDYTTTIEVDDYLNFTYSVEKLPSVELFGLVPNLTDPETGEDELVKIFIGRFDLNMSAMENAPEWGEDNSMRFCLQMYPKLNSYGNLNEMGAGNEQAERYRMRFFNKKLSEFDFHPQVAYPYIQESGSDIKKNIDWNYRTSGESAKKDYLDKLCSMEFTPMLDGLTPYYIAQGLQEATDADITEGVKTYDHYGIATTRQIINIADKVAHIEFMRPMEAIHPNDLHIVEGTTYHLFVSYGIFPDETNKDTGLVRG